MQQAALHAGAGFIRFFEDVADALVGRSQRGALGQRGKGTHGRQALGYFAQTRRAQGQYGVHFLCAIALLTQSAGQAVKHKFQQSGAGVLNQRAKGRLRISQQRGQLQRQIFLDQHADHAQSVATQGKRIFVTGGQVATAKHTDQGFELVGQCHYQRYRVARQGVACKTRFVMVLDGDGDVLAQSIVAGVIAAHGALQLGEFAHHISHQIGFSQLGCGVGRLHQRGIA